MDSEKFSNKEIAFLLRCIAAAYLIKGENRFKIIAYEKAADTIEHLSREIKDIWQEGELHNLPGIGPSISSHLDQYLSTGRSQHFEEIMKGIPETVFELTKVPSIGPKKAFKLVTALGLFNKKTLFEDIKKKAEKHEIAKIEGFGEKSEKSIIEALENFFKLKKEEGRMLLSYAWKIANEFKSFLSEIEEIERIDVLGSLRRMSPTIGDIDITVLCDKSAYKKVIKKFLSYPKRIKTEGAGEQKASIIISPYIRVDLRVIRKERYGSMLQYFTGSKSHNIKLREFALKRGFSLSEYGIKSTKDKKEFTFSSEEKFYNFIGLQYIPPELREGNDEIEKALQNKIPKLITLKDIKGDLHIHSNFDVKTSHDLGKNSIEEIAEVALNKGYKYIGITDHNPKFFGLSSKEILEILKRRKEYFVKSLSDKKFKRLNLFIGMEVDILPDGKLALPSGYEKYLDYVIASVHSSFNLNIEKMTKRVLKAITYPKVKFIGHPTGRLLMKREGFELNWNILFPELRKRDVALEINSFPQRLDLPDSIIRKSIQNGVRLIINTDSHQISHLENMIFGVANARRGWATKKDILNTLPYQEFKKWIIGD